MDIKEALRSFTWHLDNCSKCSNAEKAMTLKDMCDIGLAMWKRYTINSNEDLLNYRSIPIKE